MKTSPWAPWRGALYAMLLAFCYWYDECVQRRPIWSTDEILDPHVRIGIHEALKQTLDMIIADLMAFIPYIMYVEDKLKALVPYIRSVTDALCPQVLFGTDGSSGLGFPRSGNDLFTSIAQLYADTTYINTAILIGIVLVLDMCIARFSNVFDSDAHKGPGRGPIWRQRMGMPFSTEMASAQYGKLKESMLDTFFFILPTLVVILVLVPTLGHLYSTELGIGMADTTIRVDVIGRQWYWTYCFHDVMPMIQGTHPFMPQGMLRNAAELQIDAVLEINTSLLHVDNEILIPVNVPIQLLITSFDVIHAFAIPQIGMKVDAIPGRFAEVLLTVEHAGQYTGQCSELCGAFHGFMPIVIGAVPMEQFTEWAAAHVGIEFDLTATADSTATDEHNGLLGVVDPTDEQYLYEQYLYSTFWDEYNSRCEAFFTRSFEEMYGNPAEYAKEIFEACYEKERDPTATLGVGVSDRFLEYLGVDIEEFRKLGAAMKEAAKAQEATEAAEAAKKAAEEVAAKAHQEAKNAAYDKEIGDSWRIIPSPEGRGTLFDVYGFSGWARWIGLQIYIDPSNDPFPSYYFDRSLFPYELEDYDELVNRYPLYDQYNYSVRGYLLHSVFDLSNMYLARDGLRLITQLNEVRVGYIHDLYRGPGWIIRGGLEHTWTDSAYGERLRLALSGMHSPTRIFAPEDVAIFRRVGLPEWAVNFFGTLTDVTRCGAEIVEYDSARATKRTTRASEICLWLERHLTWGEEGEYRFGLQLKVASTFSEYKHYPAFNSWGKPSVGVGIHFEKPITGSWFDYAVLAGVCGVVVAILCDSSK